MGHEEPSDGERVRVKRSRRRSSSGEWVRDLERQAERKSREQLYGLLLAAVLCVVPAWAVWQAAPSIFPSSHQSDPALASAGVTDSGTVRCPYCGREFSLEPGSVRSLLNRRDD